MLRATLDQMRSSAGRLAAAGIAILLGTAFVTASLLASATMRQATHEAFSASYADADLVVTAMGAPLSADDVAAIRDVDGVSAVDVQSYFGLDLTSATTTEYVSIAPTPSDPRLAVGTLEEGHEATAPGEIVLSSDVADRLDVEIGDSLRTSWESWDADSETSTTHTESLEIVGLLEATDNFFATGSGARIFPAQLEEWRVAQTGSDEIWGSILLALSDGADVESVRGSLESALAAADPDVQTVPEIAEQRTAMETGSDVTFLVIMLAFAAVALAVAGLVITNTFQVLVAQRTRTLALLRCVGASRGQIRRSVLGEAALLGVISSLAGFAIGSGIIVLGVAILGERYPSFNLDGGVPFSWQVPVVALTTGVLVTLLSALVPARMATRVAPVAALRPIEGPTEEGAGRRRLALSVTATLLGAVMLAGGVLLALSLSETDSADAGVLGGLALGVFGGLISLCGVLVGSVFLIPRLLPLLGRLAGKSVPARIATANAVRNPRRTAATTNALVIGVALVVMMSTGAYSARQTLVSELDSSFPVDIVAQVGDLSQPLTQAQIDTVADTEGIASVVPVRTTYDIGFLNDNGDGAYPVVTAFAGGDPATVLRNPSVLDAVADDTVVVAPETSLAEALPEGAVVTAELGHGTSTDVELRVVHADIGDGTAAYLTAATLERIHPDLPITGVWARITDGSDEIAVAGAVQTALNDIAANDPSAPVLQVSGAAIERAAYGQVVDTLLAVVLGLLAVAVVIALVGVANTLSLSVIERRRENATLRAMGLTRGQLRGMLAVEGVLIAVVGALVGTVGGLLYGWAGAAIVLGGFGSVELGVPWVQLLAVAVVAVAAGLIASVLPARSAVRQPPVAALATD